MRKCAGGTPCHHFGFALQNLSRGRRPIKSHSNVQKSASSFCTLAWLSAWLMPDAQKKSPLHTVHVQRANVSRYHLFLCFFLAYLRDLLTGIGRAGLLSMFSLSVQKLPSIPAFLQIPLSLSGISLWRCPGMYSSFSQPLFFFAIVCIIAEDFSFVKGEFRSLLLRNFLRLFH